MKLTPSEKRLLILLAVACVVLGLLLVFRRSGDPVRGPSDLYPHVNATDTLRVDPSWPAPGDPTPRMQVTGVAVDAEDRVWVLGLGDPPVRVYDAGGRYLRGWGAGTVGAGHQIRIDRAGHVWIADTARHVVRQFDADGNTLLTLGTPDQPGEDAAHLNAPTDVAFGPGGDLFVSDGYGNARVAKFRSDGTFVKAWGGRGHRPGEFNLPHGIVADRRGRLLVADRNNTRIQIFDTEGRYLGQWANVALPWALCLTPANEVWVCGSTPTAWRDDEFTLDTPPHDQLLYRFDLDGRLLQLWQTPKGDGPGQQRWAHAVAVDSNGRLYCGDLDALRAQRFLRVPAAAGSQP